MSVGRLRTFVAAMVRLVEQYGNEEADILEPARLLLIDLVAHDDWLPDEFAVGRTDSYQQYLLYGDPLDRFSLVSFVWGPNQRTPVHDHLVWGLVGMLRGAEVAVPYTRRLDGPGLVSGRSSTLLPGMVEAVSPTRGDIHTVANALPDKSSVSIHLYGGNIGRMRRHRFDPATGAADLFVSGYSKAITPNLWAS